MYEKDIVGNCLGVCRVEFDRMLLLLLFTGAGALVPDN